MARLTDNTPEGRSHAGVGRKKGHEKCSNILSSVTGGRPGVPGNFLRWGWGWGVYNYKGSGEVGTRRTGRVDEELVGT